jgi:sugar lactone lactonase YvrE
VTARFPAGLLAAGTALLVGCTSPGAGPTSAQPSATSATGGTSEFPKGSSVIQGLKRPFGLAIETGAAWVTEYEAGNLVRIDTNANRITARVHVGPHASHVVIEAGFAWVVDDLGGALVAVDTRTNLVSKNVPMRPTPELRPIGLAAGKGSLWVVLASSVEGPPNPRNPPNQLVRVDPTGDQVLDTIPLPGNAAGVATGGGAVWVVSNLEPITIYRIDSTAKAITATLVTGHTPSGAMAYVDPYLWVANQDGDLTRIDSRTNLTASFEVGSPEWPALVAEGNAIWISAPLDNILARFDPGTGTVTRTVRAGTRPQGFAFLGNNLWVANYLDGTVAKLPIK